VLPAPRPLYAAVLAAKEVITGVSGEIAACEPRVRSALLPGSLLAAALGAQLTDVHGCDLNPIVS